MKRRDLLRGTAAALIAGRGLRRAQAAGVRKLKVGMSLLGREGGLHVAMERGYFRDVNLEIELVEIAGVMQLMTQLISGQLDVWLSVMGPAFLNAVAQGAGARIVAPRMFVSATCGNIGGIYALKKKFPKGLTDLTVLKGKMVGVGSVVGFTEYAVDLQLEKAGLGDGSVEYVHLPSGQAVLALVNGRVDAVAVLPETSHALLPIMNDLVAAPSLAASYPDIQYSFIFFDEALVKTNRDAGDRFLSAYFHGVREFRGGATPQYLREYATRNGLDADREIAACRDDLSVDAHIDRASMKRFIDWAVRRKYVPRPIEVSEVVDVGFAGKA